MDASALYDKVPDSEGLDSLVEALDKRDQPKVPTCFIKRVIKIILEWNLLTFYRATCLQKVWVHGGGVHPTPNNSYMK